MERRSLALRYFEQLVDQFEEVTDAVAKDGKDCYNCEVEASNKFLPEAER